MKRFMVKTLLTAAIMGSSAIPLAAQATPASGEIEQTLRQEKAKFDKKKQRVKTTIRKAERWTDRRMDEAEAVYNAVNSKAETLQQKALPYGDKIKAAATPDNVPGLGAVKWTTQNTSLPALLFMLLFGGVVMIIGSSYTRTYEA